MDLEIRTTCHMGKPFRNLGALKIMKDRSTEGICQERAAQMSPSHQTTNNTKTSKDGRMNREMRRRAIRPVKDLVKTEDSSLQDMTKVNNLRSNP